MPKLTFLNKNVTLEVEKGLPILEAALRFNVPLYHTCGGNCSCSTCHVRVLSGAENLSVMEADEREVLDSFDLRPPIRLGCQARLMGGQVVVEIPDRKKEPRPNKTPLIPDAK